MADDLMALREVFHTLKLTNSTGYREIRAGRLGPIYKRGRSSLMRTSDVERYRDALPTMQTTSDQKIIGVSKS